jgi:hypothetical protein
VAKRNWERPKEDTLIEDFLAAWPKLKAWVEASKSAETQKGSNEPHPTPTNIVLREEKIKNFTVRLVEFADENGYFVSYSYKNTRLDSLEYDKSGLTAAQGDFGLIASTIKNVLASLKQSLEGG